MFKSRYVKLLESENERLRVENRAMLNSLLQVSGFKPVEADPLAPKEPAEPQKPRGWRGIGKMMRQKSAKVLHELNLGQDAVRSQSPPPSN
jgi:hypothetical protein